MGIGTLNTTRRAIFFDRDGVLNEAVIRKGKPYPPASVEELIIAPDARGCLQKLKSAGFLLIGATNQPDVARGITQQTTVEAINKKLKDELCLDEIFVCYHDDTDNCNCRKPLPGLLIQAASVFNIDLINSIMIGDRWKDIEAGHRAGCGTIWLDQGYAEQKPTQLPNFRCKTLTKATEWLLTMEISKINYKEYVDATGR